MKGHGDGVRKRKGRGTTGKRLPPYSREFGKKKKPSLSEEESQKSPADMNFRAYKGRQGKRGLL